MIALVEMQVLLPKADPNMTEAKIVEWLKKEGEEVQAGESLLNVETEKVTFSVESPATGVLKKILAQPGDTIEVAKLIAVVETG